MNGGTVNQLTKQPDGIVLRIHGVGPLRHKVMMVKILPTNYNICEGDLVWWYDGCLRWERRVSKPFQLTPLDNSPITSEKEPVDTTFWHV